MNFSKTRQPCPRIWCACRTCGGDLFTSDLSISSVDSRSISVCSLLRNRSPPPAYHGSRFTSALRAASTSAFPKSQRDLSRASQETIQEAAAQQSAD